jgi:hypothetical protein
MQLGAPMVPADSRALRLGRWLGSWPFVLASAVAVAVLTVLVVLRSGPSLAVLQLLLLGLVLVELPLLFVAVRSADRSAADLATDHLDSARRLAGEVDELADTVARLAVDLARLNARLRSTPSAAHPEAEFESRRPSRS